MLCAQILERRNTDLDGEASDEIPVTEIILAEWASDYTW